MAITKITGSGITADAIDSSKIADNTIDSEHLVDAGIDDAHLATGISATKLTGTIAGARFPATLPASSGENLTSIPAGNLTGTVADARISALTASKLTGTIAAARLSTATTQSVSDNSTNVATTAYVDAQVATVVDSAPGTLNTLNELAAALGDDANFSTTTATNIAAKLPLAGGTMTGNADFGNNFATRYGDSQQLEIYHNGTRGYITNTSGALWLQTSDFRVYKGDGSERMIQADDDGSVLLYYDGNSKLATTSTGIDVTGVITTDGLTTSADISFGDNDKANFGASDELQIYHTGSGNSIISHSTGALGAMYIDAGGTLNIRNSTSGGENMIVAAGDGAVTLYYNNGAKLATTNTGVDVTGTMVVSDKLIVSDPGNINTGSSGGSMTIQGGATYPGGQIVLSGGQAGGTFVVKTESTTATTLERMRIDSGGDISFYEDTGATAKMVWDASEERLGIGTSSPSGKLHIYNTSTTSDGDGSATETASGQDSILLYGHGGVANATYGSITWMGGASRRRAMITAIADGSTDTDIVGLGFYTKGTDGPGDMFESMRISHTGNVGIGETDPNTKLHVSTGGTAVSNVLYDVAVFQNSDAAGIRLVDAGDGGGNGGHSGLGCDNGNLNVAAAGYIKFSTGLTTTNSLWNGGTTRMRIDSSGFVKLYTADATIKQSVDNSSLRLAGGNSYIGGAIKLMGGSNGGQIHLHSTTSTGNYGTAIASVTADGITFNGDTAAANALDDYEEGTCSIKYSDGVTSVGTNNNFKYTKVGRLVTVAGCIVGNVTGLTGTSSLRLTGFPFTISNQGSFPFFSRYLDAPANCNNVVGYHPVSGTEMEVWYMIDHDNYHRVACEDLHATANDCYITVSYQTA